MIRILVAAASIAFGILCTGFAVSLEFQHQGKELSKFLADLSRSFNNSSEIAFPNSPLAVFSHKHKDLSNYKTTLLVKKNELFGRFVTQVIEFEADLKSLSQDQQVFLAYGWVFDDPIFKQITHYAKTLKDLRAVGACALIDSSWFALPKTTFISSCDQTSIYQIAISHLESAYYHPESDLALIYLKSPIVPTETNVLKRFRGRLPAKKCLIYFSNAHIFIPCEIISLNHYVARLRPKANLFFSVKIFAQDIGAVVLTRDQQSDRFQLLGQFIEQQNDLLIATYFSHQSICGWMDNLIIAKALGNSRKPDWINLLHEER